MLRKTLCENMEDFWVLQLLAKIIISPIVFLGKMQQL